MTAFENKEGQKQSSVNIVQREFFSLYPYYPVLSMIFPHLSALDENLLLTILISFFPFTERLEVLKRPGSHTEDVEES